MNIESLQTYCLSFPESRENLQWGADLCFEVGGKIFAVVSLESVPPGLCFKCTPDKFAELREREGIRPAPYVGRYKWVLVEGLDVLADDELKELIRQSYEMVSAKVGHKTTAKMSNDRGRKQMKKKSREKQS